MTLITLNQNRSNPTVRAGAQVNCIKVAKYPATGVEMVNGKQITASHLSEIEITTIFDQSQVGKNSQNYLNLYCICEVTRPHT